MRRATRVVQAVVAAFVSVTVVAATGMPTSSVGATTPTPSFHYSYPRLVVRVAGHAYLADATSGGGRLLLVRGPSDAPRQVWMFDRTTRRL